MADIFSKWKDSLDRTRKAGFGRIATFFGATEIKADTWDELEGLLIQADLGVDTTLSVIENLKKKVADEGLTRSEELMQALKDDLMNRLTPAEPLPLENDPTVILLVGVNGSGKTTTAAKLGKLFSNDGKKVLLVAADKVRDARVRKPQPFGSG